MIIAELIEDLEMWDEKREIMVCIQTKNNEVFYRGKIETCLHPDGEILLKVEL